MQHTIAALLVAAFVYYAPKKLYYYYFHPLSSFDGPLAATSFQQWLSEISKGFPEKELERLHEKYRTKALRVAPNELHITDVHQCLTTDIIVDFAFAKSENIIEEKEDTFKSHIVQALDAYVEGFWDAGLMPIVRSILEWAPAGLAKMADRPSSSFTKVITLAETCVDHYAVEGNTTKHPVIFDRLESLLKEEKVGEAVEALVAGTDTTASALTSGLIHMISEPNIQERLAKLLKKVQPDEQGCLSLLELEKIDYLMACVKESLRIGMPVPGRLPRVVPESSPLIVEGKLVTPGTIVTISAYTMHFSEELWGPDVRTFNPDRWFNPESGSLDQYLCAFCKGARMCTGQK
ncbi:cytochrome P450 [Penicillium longicatenatum]|uniref:cytochrome P450 n=1 Tax=Penicillium longicatenatum TaxID=1561947 RepID=UPI0025498008|nr:cytochrome P450 [Penicillium longicatenatum]KAJ5660993.1 cytochrome P450 [Penicillium longicatenatum]